MQIIKNLLLSILFFFANCCYAESEIPLPFKLGTDFKIPHKYIYPLQQAFQIAKTQGYNITDYSISIMDFSYNDKDGREKVFFMIGFDHINSVEKNFEVKIINNEAKLYLPK